MVMDTEVEDTEAGTVVNTEEMVIIKTVDISSEKIISTLSADMKVTIAFLVCSMAFMGIRSDLCYRHCHEMFSDCINNDFLCNEKNCLCFAMSDHCYSECRRRLLHVHHRIKNSSS